MIPHNRVSLHPAAGEAVAAVLASGYIAGGPRLRALEERLAGMFGLAASAGVGSGLGALRLGLWAMGLEAGEPVLVPAYSCVALANAVLALGGQPVPVDIRLSDLNMDPEMAARSMRSSGARRAIAVNSFGAPAPVEELCGLGLQVIEDASHGMAWDAEAGRPRPSRADAVALSFYATKLVAAGEGGALAARDPELAARVRGLRDYSDDMPDGRRLNDKMTDVEAALAGCALDGLADAVARRNALAAGYRKALGGLPVPVRLPADRPDRVWYRFALGLPEGSLDTVQAGMAALGVRAEMPVTAWCDLEAFPVAAMAFRTVLSLPLYPSLTAEEQDRVAAALRTVLSRL